MTERIFLVTGATKGIGRALSDRLARSGQRVVGIARGADPTFPGTLAPIDLSDTQRAQAGLAELAERYAFDGVVNNVGQVRLAPLGQIDVADADDLFRINVHPAIMATQAILPPSGKRGGDGWST
ncbi:MAG TPA: SDR family NAD(P)-dependent oxidoreductase [Caulobacteraceae bacterium]|jgi:short-subunit dehydrogenase|nr:SDR family NAD(P)-dependent oxidoreductase [Caulobacteraceae bacterium]